MSKMEERNIFAISNAGGDPKTMLRTWLLGYHLTRIRNSSSCGNPCEGDPTCRIHLLAWVEIRYQKNKPVLAVTHALDPSFNTRVVVPDTLLWIYL